MQDQVNEAVAWMLRKSDTGFVRGIYPAAPPDESRKIAEIDGDEYVPLYTHPARGVVDEGVLRDLLQSLIEFSAEDGRRGLDTYSYDVAAARDEILASFAAQPAVRPEFMGWVHEVAWIDGTSRTLHQKEPTPLDDYSPGLTSQRVVRVFAQPAVPSVPESATWHITEAWVHGGTVAELKLQRRFRGSDNSEVTDLCGKHVTLAATPKDQP